MSTAPSQTGATAMIRLAIILSTSVTAGIHLFIGLGRVDVGFGEQATPVFILNGLGYIALGMALYLPLPALAHLRRSVRWVLLAYAALTVLLWALGGPRIGIAYADKAVEAFLILLLLVEARRGRRSLAAGSTAAPQSGLAR